MTNVAVQLSKAPSVSDSHIPGLDMLSGDIADSAT